MGRGEGVTPPKRGVPSRSGAFDRLVFSALEKGRITIFHSPRHDLVWKTKNLGVFFQPRKGDDDGNRTRAPRLQKRMIYPPSYCTDAVIHDLSGPVGSTLP